MKKLLILVPFIIAFVLMMSAGASSSLFAQSKSDASPAAPAEQKAPADEGKQDPKEKGFMVRLSHTEYADMDLKECADCHKGSGVAPTHGSDQMREHVSIARREGANCVDCHNQQFCLDCHTGGGIDADLKVSNYRANYVPKSHRTDFREIHPLKSFDNPHTCVRCHNVKFCSDCHTKFRGEDLSVLSHRRAWSDGTYTGGIAHSGFAPDSCQGCHTDGVLTQRVWSAEHGQEARRNLQACQTCHSDGDVCMTCHSARRGLKMNPHPRNWNAVKDNYRSKSGGRSCIKCHDSY